MTVTPQGFATACVVDYDNYLATTDLRNCSLKEAWESKLFKELRKKHLSGNLEGLICNNCLHNDEGVCEPLNYDLYTPKS